MTASSKNTSNEQNLLFAAGAFCLCMALAVSLVALACFRQTKVDALDEFRESDTNSYEEIKTIARLCDMPLPGDTSYIIASITSSPYRSTSVVV